MLTRSVMQRLVFAEDLELTRLETDDDNVALTKVLQWQVKVRLRDYLHRVGNAPARPAAQEARVRSVLLYMDTVFHSETGRREDFAMDAGFFEVVCRNLPVADVRCMDVAVRHRNWSAVRILLAAAACPVHVDTVVAATRLPFDGTLVRFLHLLDTPKTPAHVRRQLSDVVLHALLDAYTSMHDDPCAQQALFHRLTTVCTEFHWHPQFWFYVRLVQLGDAHAHLIRFFVYNRQVPAEAVWALLDLAANRDQPHLTQFFQDALDQPPNAPNLSLVLSPLVC